MATPQKEGLRPVTAEEWAVLEQITKASSERLDRVRRALAVLAVAQGAPFVRAAQQAGFQSGTTVAHLVSRFNQQGVEALRIAAGRGRKPTYEAAARAQLVTVAQRAADRKRDGTATWSLSTLQRTLRQEAFPRLGATTIRRVLQDAGRSYQQTRTWCPTGTAERERKSGIVRVTDPQTEAKRG
jgi:transposase